ncbi:MAG: hypothetical protein IPL28_24500 [Chloroflexi bacterium]|nr:hypothetical protein [Chloroflexota bacterium]
MTRNGGGGHAGEGGGERAFCVLRWRNAPPSRPYDRFWLVLAAANGRGLQSAN